MCVCVCLRVDGIPCVCVSRRLMCGFVCGCMFISLFVYMFVNVWLYVNMYRVIDMRYLCVRRIYPLHSPDQAALHKRLRLGSLAWLPTLLHRGLQTVAGFSSEADCLYDSNLPLLFRVAPPPARDELLLSKRLQ